MDSGGLFEAGKPCASHGGLGRDQCGHTVRLMVRPKQFGEELDAEVAPMLHGGNEPIRKSLFSLGRELEQAFGGTGVLSNNLGLDQRSGFQLGEQGIQMRLLEPPDLTKAIGQPKTGINFVAMQRPRLQKAKQGVFDSEWQRGLAHRRILIV